MNEHELNQCKLAPGDRVILTNEGLEFHGDHLQDTVFTVDHEDEPDENGETWVWFRTKDTKKLIGFERKHLTCEHETINIHKGTMRGKGPNVQNIPRECNRHGEIECDECFIPLGLKQLRQMQAAEQKAHMAHISEPATYKEPTDIMVHASTEKGKGITHYCEQLGGDNTVKITEYMNKYNANERHMELLDLLLMLAHENNALKDKLHAAVVGFNHLTARVNHIETVVKRRAHAELMREADERPEDSIEEERTDEIEYNRVVREGLKHD